MWDYCACGLRLILLMGLWCGFYVLLFCFLGQVGSLIKVAGDGFHWMTESKNRLASGVRGAVAGFFCRWLKITSQFDNSSLC